MDTAEALAAQVTEENFEKGLIYPPFSNIRKISAHIAAKVAAKAYELGECCSAKCTMQAIRLLLLYRSIGFIFFFAGLASHLPRPENLVKYAESCMYSPVYRNYR